MNPNDQVRFILRSDQLDTPISIPFLPVERLTTERVFSQIERVIQSNQEFRLNDTVTIDIIHVVTPQGSGKSKRKRTTLNVREYLKEKKSIICINNNDDFCLARALAVAIAKIENDPKYAQISRSNRPVQLERALDLHEAANVPLGVVLAPWSRSMSTWRPRGAPIPRAMRGNGSQIPALCPRGVHAARQFHAAISTRRPRGAPIPRDHQLVHQLVH